MYPTLESMGITSYDNIAKYTLRYEGGFDVLKIYYRRAKGSLLPKSKKFKFSRASRTVLTDGGAQQYREMSEPSSVVLQATEELHKLLGMGSYQEEQTKEDLLRELEHLERVVIHKVAEIKEKIEKLS